MPQRRRGRAQWLGWRRQAWQRNCRAPVLRRRQAQLSRWRCLAARCRRPAHRRRARVADAPTTSLPAIGRPPSSAPPIAPARWHRCDRASAGARRVAGVRWAAERQQSSLRRPPHNGFARCAVRRAGRASATLASAGRPPGRIAPVRTHRRRYCDTPARAVAGLRCATADGPVAVCECAPVRRGSCPDRWRRRRGAAIRSARPVRPRRFRVPALVRTGAPASAGACAGPAGWPIAGPGPGRNPPAPARQPAVRGRFVRRPPC